MEEEEEEGPEGNIKIREIFTRKLFLTRHFAAPFCFIGGGGEPAVLGWFFPFLFHFHNPIWWTQFDLLHPNPLPSHSGRKGMERGDGRGYFWRRKRRRIPGGVRWVKRKCCFFGNSAMFWQIFFTEKQCCIKAAKGSKKIATIDSAQTCHSIIHSTRCAHDVQRNEIS